MCLWVAFETSVSGIDVLLCGHFDGQEPGSCNLESTSVLKMFWRFGGRMHQYNNWCCNSALFVTYSAEGGPFPDTENAEKKSRSFFFRVAIFQQFHIPCKSLRKRWFDQTMLKKPHHLQNTDGPPTGPSWQLFYIKNITTSDHFFVMENTWHKVKLGF